MTVKQYNPNEDKKHQKSGVTDNNSAHIETVTVAISDKNDESESINSANTNIGFISLGCPKNLVDSERILTELRTDGYNIIPSYENAALVIVNTCGFIDSAVQESLETIGEALNENGKVLVTGCLGAKEIKFAKFTQKY